MSILFRPPAKPKHIFPRASNLLQIDIRDSLQRIFERDYSTETDYLLETWILSTTQLNSLVTHCKGIRSVRDLRFIPKFPMDTEFLEKYGT